MKMSFRFRLSAGICAATLFLGAFSLMPAPAHADKADAAAEAAQGAVAGAEKAAGDAEKAKQAAQEAAQKAGAKATQADKDADAAAKEADEAAKAADEAQDKAQKEQQEADAAAEAAKQAGGSDEELNKEADKQKKEAEDAKAEADQAEKTAAEKEEAAADADKKADAADKPVENRDVKRKKADARAKRRLARAARRRARRALREAEQQLAERRKREGVRESSATKGLKELLEGLKKRMERAGAPAENAGQGTVMPPSAGQTVQSVTAGGLHTTTFEMPNGRVRVYLPDDMRAGDTISGTVVAEPKGNTKEERERNLVELKGLAFEIKDFSFGVENPTTIGSATGGAGAGRIPVAVDQPFTFKVPSSTSVSSGSSPGLGITLSNTTGTFTVNSSGTAPVNPSVNTTRPTGPPTPNNFQLPTIGQQGRPVEIVGPFDGNASNTTLHFNPAGGASRDFEKRPETVVGGYGPLRPLAESPRKIVFESPTNFTGPAEVVLKEGSVETRGKYRNVGVQLSAPKTNLTRGERTTLTVEVKGLEGIRENVPLQLDSKGVINMDGGNFQNLLIKPQDIQPGGRYTTSRAITGQQAGAFNVTATVIVRRFDMCLQDDRDPRSGLLWNSFTGDYVFVNPGPAGQSGAPGGKLQPGGGAAGGSAQTGREGSVQPGGINLTGTGSPAMKGCIITLSHNAPDRRVFARLDVCTKTGSGEVQPSAPKTTLNITDSNTADNACPGK